MEERMAKKRADMSDEQKEQQEQRGSKTRARTKTRTENKKGVTHRVKGRERKHELNTLSKDYTKVVCRRSRMDDKNIGRHRPEDDNHEEY